MGAKYIYWVKLPIQPRFFSSKKKAVEYVKRKGYTKCGFSGDIVMYFSVPGNVDPQVEPKWVCVTKEILR